jgi:deoxyadenosine/deoxycytidine kinase
MSRVMGKLIILEGNISAGKSTVCRALKECLPNSKAFFEPTLSNPYLERFYADPKRFALRMQLFLFRQRYETYIDALRYVCTTGAQSMILFASLLHTFSTLLF